MEMETMELLRIARNALIQVPIAWDQAGRALAVIVRQLDQLIEGERVQEVQKRKVARSAATRKARQDGMEVGRSVED